MRRFALSLILVLNSFALAACSGYTTAAIPTSPDSDAPELKVGVQARVHLQTSEVHEGEIVAVSETHVTLGVPSNHGFVETPYAFDEIEKCEVQSLEGAQKAGAIGVIVVAVACVAAIVALASAFRIEGGF
jgi:hypothetical protein